MGAPARAGSVSRPAQEAGTRLGIPLADPNRLNDLTILYAELATSDPVRQLMRRDGPIGGKIIATPVVVQDGRNTLPLIDLVAIATSPQGAMKLAVRSAKAFETYLPEQQRANNVPDADRVVVEQVHAAARGDDLPGPLEDDADRDLPRRDVRHRRADFLLENLRPRRREPDEPALWRAGTAQRRTA